MTAETVKRLSETEISDIYTRYLVYDFPKNETKPLSAIKKALERGIYEAYGMYEGEKLAAYAFFVRCEGSYLLDYFAVTAERRGQGYGSLFLKKLKEIFKDADSVTAEVEDPERAEDGNEKETREKRLSFYLRAGFCDTGVRVRTFGVDYMIIEMLPQGRTDEKEFRKRYLTFYKELCPRFILKRVISFHD